MERGESVLRYDPFRAASPEEVKPFRDGQEYGQLTMRAQTGRRVSIMKTGYVGLVPPLTQDGDVVGIVQGEQTPFVFRATGIENGLMLWGECYVHGSIKGSFIEGNCCDLGLG